MQMGVLLTWIMAQSTAIVMKNHWNSDLFQDHGKVIEFHEKLLKFVKMKKSWKNHWILDQLLMEKSLNYEIDMFLTNYMGK